MPFPSRRARKRRACRRNSAKSDWLRFRRCRRACSEKQARSKDSTGVPGGVAGDDGEELQYSTGSSFNAMLPLRVHPRVCSRRPAVVARTAHHSDGQSAATGWNTRSFSGNAESALASKQELRKRHRDEAAATRVRVNSEFPRMNQLILRH